MSEGRHNGARRSASPEQLTAREREVLDLLTAGMGPVEIAGKLFISYHTVTQHLAALRAKCGARSTLELAVKSLRGGLP